MILERGSVTLLLLVPAPAIPTIESESSGIIMGIPATSPFSKTSFQVYGEYSKRSSHMALKTRDGQILINFNDGTTYAMLKQVADVLKAEIITVKGTWTFVPDTLFEEDQTDE